jgi:hypothetical protein
MSMRAGVVGVLALVWGGFGCNTSECPDGRAEANGGCADPVAPAMCVCGENTHYDNVMLACVPDYPSVVCGVGTMGEVGSDGVTVCKRAPEGTPTVTRVIGAEEALRPGQPLMPGTSQLSACCAGATQDDGGSCVATYAETVCDPNTTIAADTDSGVVVCQPIDPGSCPQVCNSPDPGNVTVCGQLVDIETNRAIGADVGAYCDPQAPTSSGACALQVVAYDALSFASNPSSSPLPADSIQINECGEFAIHNVPAPALGYLAVAADDAKNGSLDDYALTGVAMQVSGGQRITGVRLYATTRATDAKWTSSAGDPFGGATFSERGAVFMLFHDQSGAPLPGVTATANGSPRPASTYYFSDTDPDTRAVVDPAATVTGTNGAALLVDSDLYEHNGTLAGCNFTGALADAIPGVIFATERVCE